MGVVNLSVRLAPGSHGKHRGKDVEIKAILGPDKLLLFDHSRMESYTAGCAEFEPNSVQATVEQVAIHDETREWKIAEARFAVIEPLVCNGQRRLNSREVKARAEWGGVHPVTVYNWMRSYWDAAGALSGLRPRWKVRGARGRRLDPVADSLMVSAINDLYLKGQQRTIASVHRSLKEICFAAGISCPHYMTVRDRIRAIPSRERPSETF